MAAKEKKSVKSEKKKQATFFNTFSLDKIIPAKFQTLLLLVLILLIFYIFYSPLYFGGKTFQSGDIITSEASKTYVQNHQGGYTLWNPYIFCGMPAYAISVGYKWFNIVYVVSNIFRSVFSAPFNNEYAMWTFYLLALAYTMFFFMHNKTKDKLVSLFSALTVSFSTGLVVFLFIGHVTKLTAIFVFPVILLLLLNFQKQIRFLDIMLLLFFIPLMFLGWHVQIIFYVFFAVMIYFIYFIIRSLIKKDTFLFKQLLKSAGIFLFAVIVGLGIQSDNFTQVWEYTPYSTRGTESILDKQAGETNKTETNFYEYATDYSFSPGEVLTWIIPSFYGFGNSTYNGPLSNNQDVEANTYFGQMRFVDVAMYMGVIVFFLAIFSVIINWKDPFVRYLTILIVIATLVSFGKTFPVVYDLMFLYFPFFDKFRVPSMMLVLVQLTLPILAGLGIAKLISLKNENDRSFDNIVRNIFFVLGSVFVLTLVLASPIKSWFIDRIADSGRKDTHAAQLTDYTAEMFLNDSRLAFFFSAAVFGLMFAYLRSAISKDIMIVFIILIAFIDLARIDNRGETYRSKSDMDALFTKPEYISAIESLNDKSVYRIINLKKDGFGNLGQNSNFNAFFLQQDVYGYSGIKPRGYQDYMEIIGSPANETFMRMTNVKYLVFDNMINVAGFKPVYTGNQTFVFENLNALPRAYFVNSVEKSNVMDILNRVKNNQFDPKEIAYVENLDLKIDKPDSSTYVNIEKYADENIYLNVKASGNNFMFLGDTYVGKGWKAYIDEKETLIYKANHNFRGIIVPAGEHKIHFEYLPESFVITKMVSLVLSSLVVLGLLFSITLNIRKKKVPSEN